MADETKVQAEAAAEAPAKVAEAIADTADEDRRGEQEDGSPRPARRPLAA